MHEVDWIILFGYLAFTVCIGIFLGKLIKNSSDMFAAGGKSPWWLSGLSAFMTMFSANTFVVWGGIAYEHGFVAVAINICYGIAALLVGFTVADKWKELGVVTPAEYVEKRFGRAAVHFYTWFMLVFRLVGTGGALYAIARLTVATIFEDGSGSSLSFSNTQLNLAILIFTLVVVGYTMVGGLWAVLVTDTVQFIVLNLAIIFVIPLSIKRMGGLEKFFNEAPEGFFSLTQSMSDETAKYTWLFLFGWVAIHYFMIGAEWAFVQRYLCVPTKKDARKSTYLFGGLYLLSPVLWLLPPLLWRVQQPIPEFVSQEVVTHLSETAYIMSCKAVLPVGMLGLMLAALFSATASMISSQLNVFSGVLTENIYKPFVGEVGEQQLVRIGRIFTLILGVCIATIAIATPFLGGAASVIISVTELMVTPLLAPTLFALLSPRLGMRTIWLTVGFCFPIGLISKFTSLFYGFWLSSSTFSGVLLPVGIVLAVITFSRKENEGWKRLHEGKKNNLASEEASSSTIPILIIGLSLGVCALTLFSLIAFNDENQSLLFGFGLALSMISMALVSLYKKLSTAQRSHKISSN